MLFVLTQQYAGAEPLFLFRLKSIKDVKIRPYITWGPDIYKALQEAFKDNVDVISCSMGWSGLHFATIESDINKCFGYGRKRNDVIRGIVMCFAAGNEGWEDDLFFPANLDNVLGIIATHQLDQKTSFSNYGVKFDVAAPGTNMISTDLLGSAGYNKITNGCAGASDLSNDYTYFLGTSASTPVVAGVCALILAVEPRIPAGMGTTTGNNVGIQYILQNTADKVGGYDYNYNPSDPGRSLELGFGRIDAYQAILSALSWDPNNKTVTPLGCGHQHFIEPIEKLIYTINFQNLGEGAATLVVLKDTLDSDLDLSTLQLLESKHPYTFQILSGNIAEWTFNPIYLTPATVDNEDSKGFVKYSILPKTTVLSGDRIENKTAIYFDQNEVVITKKVINTISISPPPIASIAEGNQSICEGNTATFTASQGDSYLWNTGDKTQSITVNIAGNYTVRVSYINACENTATSTLTVIPNISNFTFNRHCNDNKFDFTYTGSLTNPSLFWNFGSNAIPSASTQINPTVMFTSFGIHEITLTITSSQDHCNTTTKNIQIENINCDNNKILMCHKDPNNPAKPQETICINRNSLSTHLAHGDCIGSCQPSIAMRAGSNENENIVSEELTTSIILKNAPNPFNLSTNIDFIIPQAEYVKLDVYNYLGTKITTLFEGYAKEQKLYSIPFITKYIPSGIYFYSIQTSNEKVIQKMLLIK